MRPVAAAEERVHQLRELLRQVEHATADVPLLDRPLGALGAPGVWRGRAAEATRADVEPLAARLSAGLTGFVDAVRAELAAAERELVRLRTDEAAG